MSEYVISKEDLLERLKARVAGDPARVVENLQAELTRLKVPFDSDLAKEAISKFSEQSVADADLPCRCRSCLWNVICGEEEQESNHKKSKSNVCPFFLGSTIPRWKLAFAIYLDRNKRMLLRYEGGIIERSPEYLEVLRTLRGEVLKEMEEKAILDKKDLLAELRDLREAQQRIAILYHGASSEFTARNNRKDWKDLDERDAQEEEVARLRHLYHSSGGTGCTSSSSQ